ncbi:MAG: sulfite exporter TauE/SafE family protein [Bacteroidetes bacterium]|nr:sulfite exporter TauE/SafE family protein [Bacteroidota bacterium]
MYNYVVESLLLGLSVGPICLAYCSPIVVPLLTSSTTHRLSTGSLTLLLFLTGRFIGYMLVGIVVGIIGNNIHQYVNGSVFGIVSIALGLTLIFFSIQKNIPEKKLCRLIMNSNSQRMFPVLLGFLTGLNLCPPFLAAIVGATSTGSVVGTMIYFSAFFIGTATFFPIMIFWGLLSKIDSVRTISYICMMISGVWFILKGLFFF